MNHLVFNFLKRFVLVPLVLTSIVIACIAIFVPPMVDASNIDDSKQLPNVVISSYNYKDYNKFSELEDKDYVATLTSEEIGVNCAVCYNSSTKTKSAELLSQSKEPWNNGNVAVIGQNSITQFKRFHNAVEGTEVKISYYQNAKYTYVIKKIENISTKNDIMNYLKSYDLVLAIPYKNFASQNDENLYNVYLAEREGVE